MFTRLARLDAVVICELNGDALGGGLELALAADLRIAVEGIRLGFPETGIGAIPGWLGCARQPQVAGPARARQMILTAKLIDARKAEAWGLVNEVVPRADLKARCEALAQAIAQRSPVALSAAKRILDAESQEAIHELAATACMASADAAEGMRAFREERAPHFQLEPSAPAGGAD